MFRASCNYLLLNRCTKLHYLETIVYYIVSVWLLMDLLVIHDFIRSKQYLGCKLSEVISNQVIAFSISNSQGLAFQGQRFQFLSGISPQRPLWQFIRVSCLPRALRDLFFHRRLILFLAQLDWSPDLSNPYDPFNYCFTEMFSVQRLHFISHDSGRKFKKLI